MDENKKRLLEAAGVDIEDALSRFMNNEALMIRMLLRFAEDKNFSRLRQAMEEKDVSGAFEAAHALKGLTGNSFTEGTLPADRYSDRRSRRGDLAALQRSCRNLRICFAARRRTSHGWIDGNRHEIRISGEMERQGRRNDSTVQVDHFCF